MGDAIDPKPDVDIVLVSVFRSGKVDSKDDFAWPEGQPGSLFKETVARTLTYSYHDLVEKKTVHTRIGLEGAAQELLDTLVVHREGEPVMKRPLAFICQDLGGIILKNVLVLAALNREKYRNVLEQTYSIVFFGCPHRIPDTPNFIDRIAVWLSSHSYTTFEGLFNASRSLASSISDINGLFLDTGMMTRCQIVNVVIEYSDTPKQVFSPYTVTLDVPMELKVLEPHSFLKLMFGGKTKISERLQIILSPNSWRKTHHRISEPPLLYPCQDELSDDTGDWEKRSIVVNEWLETPDCRFLHLVNNSSHPASFLSKLKSQDKSNNPARIFYFCFRKYDVRLNNCTALLTTLITQASMGVSFFPTGRRVEALERASSGKHLSKKDLLRVLGDLWAHYQQRGLPIIVVIWNLDGCAEPLSWLVDTIANLETFSEVLPRILFQSSGIETLTELMRRLRATTVKESVHPPQSGYQLRCEHEVANLMRIQPSLGSFDDALSNILARHRNHNALDIAITHWVCRHVQSLVAVSEAADVASNLANLSNITTQDLIMKMMATIPLHRLRWAKKILAWTRVSFRPLTIWELKDAVYLEATSDHLCTSLAFEDELKTCLSGLITVENNEVYYIHPSVRQYLTHQECVSQAWHTSTAEAHLEVLQGLLAYLARTKKTPLSFMPFRQDLGSYAIAFLLSHCLEVRKSNPTSALPLYDEVRGHLASFSNVQPWESSPTLEPQSMEPESGRQDKNETYFHKATVTFIIRRSRHGLTTRDIDELCPGWSEHNDVIQAALVEAVLCNDTALLKALPIPPLEEMDTSALLNSVILCDDPGLISYLFDKTRKLEEFPATFLRRAVFLGVKEIINSLLEGRASCGDLAFNFLDDLLLEAIESHNAEVVGNLTTAMKKAGQKLSLVTLNMACHEGEPRSIDHILEDGFVMASLEDIDVAQEPWRIACTYGNWKAAQNLVAKRVFSKDEDKKYLWASLQIAVGQGFVKCTTQMLALINPKACSESDRESLWKVLMHGIVQGQVETCRALLTSGVDPNEKETWEQAPVLSWAVRSQNRKLIKLLREYKVPFEGKDNLGNTPIFLAATLGLLDTVSFLIDEGANINARAEFGGTALYQACINNELDIVKILLDHGADVQINTHEGNWSPLEAAYDYPKVLRLLVEKDVDYKRVASGATALWYAARDGYVESVEILLSKQGCEVDFCPKELTADENGWTALAMAAKGGHSKVARRLLEAGANVDHVNPVSGDFVLKMAMNEEVMAVLLEYGPDVRMTDKIGVTALHYYVVTEGIMRRLINNKAEINSRNKKGSIPLHYACQFSNLDAVKLLVKNGANVNASDSEHGTPLAYTFMSDEEQLEKIKYLFEDAGVKLDTLGEVHGVVVLGTAALRSDMRTVEYLIEHGGKKLLNDGDMFGRPLLFHAYYRKEGALEMVEYLVEQGAAISDHKDVMGRTALHCAAVTHNVELVRKLIKTNKKLLDETDEDGWTPLHWAMRHAYVAWLNSQDWHDRLIVEDDMVQTVEALLDGDLGRRSRVATAGDRDWTPLKLARYHGVYEIVKHLLSPPAEEDGSISTESPQLYESPVAKAQDWVCDACFCQPRGFYYKCLHEGCVGNFGLCFKCIAHKDRFHNTSHEFERIGPEFESKPDDEQPDGGEVNVVEPAEAEAPTWDYITMEDP
ncbi:ankyrin repeat-containing domain protein [Dactylonectria macrodidyma]|uniref:Ankyrin repeat-containing domain protein n=1 Tax=Dactylonectria macrodidyma TaxID=307937 RepID=A0A9P9J6D6_9HYPO|nr:ankyrin repeat-containing domain protein [Dactylonectria macrodidyma]